MTKEEAIKILNTVLCLGKCDCPKDEIEECLKMAIEALKTQPNEDEKVIRIKKGTLKGRTGRFALYDVEWLRHNFNTTEAKIYGQQQSEGARGDIPLQQSVPKMPHPSERTEERTETHECDCISRDATLTAFSDYVGGGMSMNDFDAMWDIVVKMPPVEPKPKTSEDCISRQAAIDALHSYFAEGFNEDRWWNSTHVLDAVNRVPSVTPQPKEEPQQKTGHWIGHREHCEMNNLIPSGLGVYEWCSNCDYGIDIRDWHRISHNYCPKCGCRMQEEK